MCAKVWGCHLLDPSKMHRFLQVTWERPGAAKSCTPAPAQVCLTVILNRALLFTPV